VTCRAIPFCGPARVNRVRQGGSHEAGRIRGRVSRSSLILSRAAERGRADRTPASRVGILAALLRKRATASTHGADEVEQMLREQIRWSLPIERD
jgi:hypothetical protein